MLLSFSAILYKHLACHMVSHWEDRNMITTIPRTWINSSIESIEIRQVNFGTVSPYTQLYIYPLSLSLSLNLKKD